MTTIRQSAIPFTLALLMHAAIVATFYITVDLSGRMPAPSPLAIKATLVTDSAVSLPPPPREEPVEPDPVPPAVEPEPEPDTAEQARVAAEQEKRRQDALIEQQRLEEIKQREEAEAKARAEEEARREREEEARRQREAEAEKERQRIEAERKRREDIERQRAENERQRREAEAAQRQSEIAAEERRLAAIDSGARAAYMFKLEQSVMRNWARPPSARPGIECEVRVRQLPTGAVQSATIVSCNGGPAVERSIVAAVEKASPLPLPDDPSVFDRNLMLVFKPEE